SGQFEGANCPYVWSHTICVILSLTNVSIFITINLWLKFLLRIISLIGFWLILSNDCSLYQTITAKIVRENQWSNRFGFDPISSHLYYMIMAVVIVTIIDRQIEYVIRLDFKLRKRLRKEKEEAQIMSEINDILLKNILPSYVVQKYLDNRSMFTNQIYSETYEFCAVTFASIPNFSDFYSENELNDNGLKCLQVLNEIICDFDQLLSYDRFRKIEKIKTIGSTYMAAAGLQPGRASDENNESRIDERKHTMNIIHFVMALMETLKRINKDGLQDFKLRVGIAVGPVIAGIVGASKPQYDIWGDTVNVASRMESTGVIGRIQLTQETAKIILQVQGYTKYFTLEPRGSIKVKGKGSLQTYLVKSRFDFEETEITHV
ncbi:adenylate cyclase type 2-like protein 3, partial [Sarcoptes scabiei]